MQPYTRALLRRALRRSTDKTISCVCRFDDYREKCHNPITGAASLGQFSPSPGDLYVRWLTQGGGQSTRGQTELPPFAVRSAAGDSDWPLEAYYGMKRVEPACGRSQRWWADRFNARFGVIPAQ